MYCNDICGYYMYCVLNFNLCFFHSVPLSFFNFYTSLYLFKGTEYVIHTTLN